MTAAELMEITLLLREEAQRQFEYWLTISFAIIAATFIARKFLTAKTSALLGTRCADRQQLSGHHSACLSFYVRDPIGALVSLHQLRWS